MKLKRNIVMFGNARWREDICGNSSQQLSLAFLQLGYRVLYITPNRGTLVSLPEFSGRFQILSVSNKVVEQVRNVLKDWSAGPEDTLFICSLATKSCRDLLNFFSAGGFEIIYRYVDSFDPSNREHGFNKSTAALACQVSRLITVSHPDLIHDLPSKRNRVITMTNGVEFDLFCRGLQEQKKPADLVTGAITIGFWGSFWGNRMNWPLLRFVATNPDWHLNLIAEIQYLDTDSESLPPNIHLLSLKKKEELPAYLKYFHVCLIPYRTDFPFSKYSNPIKALEALAAMKPVVTPVNRSLENYPGVFFYTSAEEAANQIRNAATAKLNEQEILEFVQANTWKKKAELLLQELHAA